MMATSAFNELNKCHSGHENVTNVVVYVIHFSVKPFLPKALHDCAPDTKTLPLNLEH